MCCTCRGTQQLAQQLLVVFFGMVCVYACTGRHGFVGARSCVCFLCMMHLRLARLTHTGFHKHARQTAFKHNPYVSVLTCFVCSVVFGNYGRLLLGCFVHSDQQRLEQGWLWLPTHAYRRLPRVHRDLHCMCLLHRHASSQVSS